MLPGTVRTIMPYGAFIDLGGVDGLLHVSDMAHTRITKPEDVLTVGQELQVKILKIDPETREAFAGTEAVAGGAVGDCACALAGRPAHYRQGDRADGLWRVCGD